MGGEETGNELRCLAQALVLWASSNREIPNKCFEMWWPGTELNRRRQPFQTGVNEYLQRLNMS
jgi:hypothetical protein